jgi:hypothetical protein
VRVSRKRMMTVDTRARWLEFFRSITVLKGCATGAGHGTKAQDAALAFTIQRRDLALRRRSMREAIERMSLKTARDVVDCVLRVTLSRVAVCRYRA